jgi:hypothetical protein
MSIDEVRRHTGISKTQIQRQIRDGRLRVIRVGMPGSPRARVMIRVSDYEAWLDSMYSEPKVGSPDATVAPLRSPQRRAKAARKSTRVQK